MTTLPTPAGQVRPTEIGDRGGDREPAIAMAPPATYRLQSSRSAMR